MKRRILIFVIFLTIFGFEIVNAGSCPDNSEYDCAYCHYSINEENGCYFSFSVLYKSDGTPLEYTSGNGGANIGYTACSFEYKNLKKDNFRDSSGNVFCPNLEKTRTVTGSGRQASINIKFTPNTSGALKPTGSSVIKKGTLPEQEEPTPTTVCNYDGACGPFTVSVINDNVVIDLQKEPTPTIRNGLNVDLFKDGNCPEVYTYHNTRGENACYFSNDSTTAGRFESSDGEEIDQNTNEPINSYVPDTLRPDLDNLSTITDCESLLGSPSTKPSGSTPGSPAYYMMFVFNIIKYIAIILLVTLSIVDFVKAVAAKDDDSIKKAINTTIKRLILCVVVFLLPTLIEVLLEYVHTSAIDTCGIQ